MTADKDIGRLEGKMDMVIDKVDSIEAKVDQIRNEGCSRREAHEEDLKGMDKRICDVEALIKKALLIGLVTAGGGAGIIKVVESLLQ